MGTAAGFLKPLMWGGGTHLPQESLGLGLQAVAVNVGCVSYTRPGTLSPALCCSPVPRTVLVTHWVLSRCWVDD